MFVHLGKTAEQTWMSFGRWSLRTKIIFSYHILSSVLLHWLKINERIQYKLLPLAYKVLTTSQPDYLHNLISVQSTRRLELAPHLLSP